MILLKMLPGVLKELIMHVPTVLFKVVDWNELAAEVPKLSRRILKNEGHDELLAELNDHLKPLSIELKDNLSQGYTPDKVSGTKLLELYFSQLYSPSGYFLDLRSQHFQMSGDQLEWKPTGLWTKLTDKFRSGILKVYEGFYLQDDALYRRGLEEIGLLDLSWSNEDKAQLAELFESQFGKAQTEDIGFTLSHLKDSILKLSEFMLNKQVHISKDFLYLGIYLVTLYAHLEETGAKFPVKDIYLKVRRTYQPQ